MQIIKIGSFQYIVKFYLQQFKLKLIEQYALIGVCTVFFVSTILAACVCVSFNFKLTDNH